MRIYPSISATPEQRIPWDNAPGTIITLDEQGRVTVHEGEDDIPGAKEEYSRLLINRTLPPFHVWKRTK